MKKSQRENWSKLQSMRGFWYTQQNPTFQAFCFSKDCASRLPNQNNKSNSSLEEKWNSFALVAAVKAFDKEHKQSEILSMFGTRNGRKSTQELIGLRQASILDHAPKGSVVASHKRWYRATDLDDQAFESLLRLMCFSLHKRCHLFSLKISSQMIQSCNIFQFLRPLLLLFLARLMFVRFLSMLTDCHQRN